MWIVSVVFEVFKGILSSNLAPDLLVRKEMENLSHISFHNRRISLLIEQRFFKGTLASGVDAVELQTHPSEPAWLPYSFFLCHQFHLKTGMLAGFANSRL